MKKVALLAGARPNYMKVFPVWKQLQARQLPVQQVLIHTGQHYDDLMSDIFFRDFGMSRPDYFLGVGSGSHGVQTAKVMIALEELFTKDRPDLLLVVGDVNSTVAGALVGVKMGIPVAHLEAGLRSFDRAMPEEINRLATDVICDYLLTSCQDADTQLLREGIPAERIKFVGNAMIDSLVMLEAQARKSPKPAELGVAGRPFVLVTLHRPSNVDSPARLRLLMENLAVVAKDWPVVFPVHPRTRKMMEQAGIPAIPGIILTDPLGYLDFLAIESAAALVVTDSGGVQEETSYLGVPCLTVRPNTERPVTVTEGTNRLIDPERESLSAAVAAGVRGGRRATPCAIPGWDGRAAERVVDFMGQILAV